MLEHIGVDTFDEQVYLAVLRNPDTPAAQLARDLGCSAPRVRQATKRLYELGLLQERTGRLSPTEPRTALNALTRARLAELQQLATVADELTSLYRAGRLRADPAQLGSIISGPSAIGEWFTHLVNSAQHEILLLDGPPHSAYQETTGDAEAGLLARGVSIRVIYAETATTDDRRLAKMHADIAAGEQARLLPTVPTKLLIADRNRAILPLTPGKPDDGVLIIERSGLLLLLTDYYERLWSQAADIQPASDKGDPDRKLLGLLTTGLTDESIARQLGISGRTLRRRITSLLERLGASSRFHAGVEAARRGLI